MSIAVTTSQIWSALRGLICLHKPSGQVLINMVNDVNDKILKELNESNPEYQERLENIFEIQKNNGLVDYSSHPLVLGDTYDDRDLAFDIVNDLNDFTSGLSLVTINTPELCQEIKEHVLLRQYLLEMELGKATDNGFSEGKVVERSDYRHLKGRPQLLEKQLSQIRTSHQRDAFRQSGVNLQSKEAYNLAVKGLVRPMKEHEGYTLIYGLECVHFKPPNVTLKVTCINESPIYLAEFTSELGLRLRTNAVMTNLQLVRYGPFNAKNSLLPKHVNLQNVILSVNDNFEAIDVLRKNASKTLIYS